MKIGFEREGLRGSRKAIAELKFTLKVKREV